MTQGGSENERSEIGAGADPGVLDLERAVEPRDIQIKDDDATSSRANYPVRTIDAASADEVNELEEEWRRAHRASQEATWRRRFQHLGFRSLRRH